MQADIRFGGGRFDGTDLDPYPFAYFGESDHVAVAEALLRDVPADDRGARFLAKRYWTGRQISRVELTQEAKMVDLRSGPALGAIGQDTWLTTCGPEDYPQTRSWAEWLRIEAPDAHGITWLSKREPGAEVYVFFGDRTAAGALTGVAGPVAGDAPFDKDQGFAWLKATLATYRVSIRK